uniref:PH domain-containing protein n=1 Tax=Serinus canaria TaxID=9135 RepID=A0A8C9MLW1_SERCA
MWEWEWQIPRFSLALLPAGLEEIPRPIQDSRNILKQGFLEKRSREPSFFGSEWHKRWCVLTQRNFLYYANEKSEWEQNSQLLGGKAGSGHGKLQFPAPGRGNPTWIWGFFHWSEGEFPAISQNFPAISPSRISWTFPFPGIFRPRASVSLHEKPAPEPHPGVEKKLENPNFGPIPFSQAKNSDWDYSSYYQGLWDCRGDNPDELSFRRGDLIRILSKVGAPVLGNFLGIWLLSRFISHFRRGDFTLSEVGAGMFWDSGSFPRPKGAKITQN